MRNEVAEAKAVDNQIKSLTDKMNRLRDSYRTNQTQIKNAEVTSALAKDFENLQRRDTEMTREIARLRARLEHDEQFQSEVKNGLCPILSQKCLNLKPGETLETFLNSQFVELKTQISTFENQQRETAAQLQTSREAEKFSATLETLRRREREIKEEGTRLNEELKTLQNGSEDSSKPQTDLTEIESKLKALDNPKARIQLFEAEAKREREIREKSRKSKKIWNGSKATKESRLRNWKATKIWTRIGRGIPTSGKNIKRAS